MKAGVLALALVAGVSAGHSNRRHAHEAFHLARNYVTSAAAPDATCDCTTIYTTITGEGSLHYPVVPATTYSAMKPKPTGPPVVPTPLATTCPTPGVYTIPATTLTLTASTTVCAATHTPIGPGTYTAGGVVTVVDYSTTVVCPYATVSTANGVETSTILTTTYVCPSAGTYTIAPLTTTCTKSTVWVYPTPASYAPGTYTQAEVVTTVTETDYVVVCPYTTSTPAPVAPTYAAVAPQYAAAPPPKSAPAPGGKLGKAGNQWAITYSPYQDNGLCKEKGDVEHDIAIIAGKGFSTVRVYSSDCSGLDHIGAACEAHGLTMIIGVFISKTGCAGAQQQVHDIIAWGKWELVELIVIGNEAIFNHYTNGPELAAFIAASKQAFAAKGYTGPCTTTEPLNVWQENAGALCGVVEVVGCNIHPFFNGAVTPATAGTFTASQLAIVDGLCPGKYGVNLETGWPSAGTCNGNACPGKEEQAIAIKAITEAVGGQSVVFSYVNDLWKDPGAFGCEQSWGTIQLF